MPTTLIRSLSHMTLKQMGGVVTLGNFDGVHLGHQKLLAATIKQAKALGVPSIAITFEPHPFEFFSRERVTIPRITRLREKFVALAQCGIDHVIILPFNQSLASISASDFVEKILWEKLKPVHLIVGDDFHFGHQRQGDIHLLQAMGAKLGFTAEAIPTVILDDLRVSSTRVRQALQAGDHALANRLLGHAYTMQGRISYGDQLGSKLGFPTANIFVHRQLTAVHGIYTVYVHDIAGHPLPGVANIGTRPTVDGTRTLLEVHLLHFDQNIYGRYVEVEFCEKLREEERYASLDILKTQIANDVDVAKAYFKEQGVL
jgi:riboflavin kinase/FMN adenylyltransferase